MTGQTHPGDTEPNTRSPSTRRPQPLPHVGSLSFSHTRFQNLQSYPGAGLRDWSAAQTIPASHWPLVFVPDTSLAATRSPPASSQRRTFVYVRRNGAGARVGVGAEVKRCWGRRHPAVHRARKRSSGLGFPTAVESAQPSRALCSLGFRPGFLTISDRERHG